MHKKFKIGYNDINLKTSKQIFKFKGKLILTYLMYERYYNKSIRFQNTSKDPVKKQINERPIKK